MKSILKQIVGIDVAQKELVVSIGRLLADLSIEIYASKTFANTEKGFSALLLWVKKSTQEDIFLGFVMEATGVYHEKFAYFLEEKGFEISIVLPNKISNYIRTLNIKTVTDKTCAEAITRFGLERKLDSWRKPKTIFRNMRQLTRERDQIVEERTMAKNQLHAEETEAFPNRNSIKRLKARIILLNKQEKEIKTEISALIAADLDIKRIVLLLCTIPGIAELTASIILAETNGFELIRSRRQLTSYAGLDVREKQSGTSIKGKAKISKKGNKHLRKAMHLPALSAIRWDGRFKAVFTRLVSKHGIKMQAAVAVQRKLLEMAYTVFKTNKKYDKEYLKPEVQDETRTLENTEECQ